MNETAPEEGYSRLKIQNSGNSQSTPGLIVVWPDGKGMFAASGETLAG